LKCWVTAALDDVHELWAVWFGGENAMENAVRNCRDGNRGTAACDLSTHGQITQEYRMQIDNRVYRYGCIIHTGTRYGTVGSYRL